MDERMAGLLDQLGIGRPAMLPPGNGRLPRRDKRAEVVDREVEAEPWPEQIDQAAFHGLAGEIVRTIDPHTEADPVAILGQTLVAFGNLIGRTSCFRAEADCHFGNLFLVLVGSTSKGRKGSSWGQVARVMGQVDEEWAEARVKNGLSSGEGVIWAVRDEIVRQEPIREGGRKGGPVVGYEEVIADAGVDDKRLLVVETEFASVLKAAARERNTLSPVIRAAWDTGTLRTLTKNSPAVATDAHISIIGHITSDELRRLVTETDLANGLANRILWLCVRRSKCLPDGGALNDADLAPLITRLKYAAAQARSFSTICRDDQARRVWHEVYPALSEGRPGLLGAATSRAEAQTMRLAMLYALLDESPVIRVEHLMAALALWDYADRSARHVWGSSFGNSVADAIIRALREAAPKGLSRTDLRSLFSGHRGADDITDALTTLVKSGMARCEREETPGRPKEVWYAT